MRWILLALALLISGPAAAQQPNQNPGMSIYIKPLGYCQLSVSTAAAISTCSGGIPALTAWAVISVESNAIRWRDDGTNPTASVGMPISAGGSFYYNGTMSALVLIAQSGTATVDISFYTGPGQQ